MPKVLCWTALFFAAAVFFVFALDLALPVDLAPLKGASKLMDIVYVLCAGGLAYLSWTTLQEQD